MNSELRRAEKEIQHLKSTLNKEVSGHAHCNPFHPSGCADPHHISSCKSLAEQAPVHHSKTCFWLPNSNNQNLHQSNPSWIIEAALDRIQSLA